MIGALCLGRVTQHLSSNGVLGFAAMSFALAFGSLALAPNLWAALPLLVVCGFGWMATVSTIISELQLFLPGWVRARAIGIYLMVFLGSQALASPIWGLVTQHLGLRVAIVAAASMVGVSALAGLVLKVPESHDLDRSALAYWGGPPGLWSLSRMLDRLWCPSSTRSPPTPKKTSCCPWSRRAAPDCAAAPLAGTFTGSGKARVCSASSSKCQRGPNSSASTTDALPPRTRPSRTRPLPTSWALHARGTCSLQEPYAALHDPRGHSSLG